MNHERTVLGALLEAHPAPLSYAELVTMLGDGLAVHDAIGALQRDGLANVTGDLVFASRAAVRGDELAI
jgi:hypothetical protein